MQNVTIICVGKLKEQYLRDAINEYSKRLGAFCKFSIVELNESKMSQAPSEKEIDKALQTETDDILSKIPDSAFVVAMCIEGKQLSSEELSYTLQKTAIDGKANVVFIIGSSCGLADKVKNRADLKLSVSKMTFPHQLFRVMLTEQIYRAFSITKGTKYHK